MWPKLVLSAVYVYDSELRLLSIQVRGFSVLIQCEDMSGHEENPTERGGWEEHIKRKRGIGRVFEQ